MSERGFTFIELIIAATVFTIVIGAVMGLSMTSGQLFTTTQHAMHASTRAHGVMDRIISELQQASFRGEDIDEDDDPNDLLSEDTNDNGRIDDDWSLPDGTSAASLSFNMAVAGGQYSDVVSFRFDGERVWRESGSTNPVRALLAEDVITLTFARQAKRISINLVVESGVAGRGRRRVSLQRDIMIRN